MLLLSSKFFTNEKMFAAWPGLFGREGVFAILLWGLAYISVCVDYRSVPFLVLVFAVEKAYFCVAYFSYKAQLKAAGPATGDLPVVADNAQKPFRFFVIPHLAEVEPKSFIVVDFPCMVFFLYVAFSTWFGFEKP